jgi:hypothetical protein
MVFEKLGHCPPHTSISGRILFLSGCSPWTTASGQIPRDALVSVVDLMRKRFNSPKLKGEALVRKIGAINSNLRSRNHRALPEITLI